MSAGRREQHETGGFEPLSVIPIATVRGGRTEPVDDIWGEVEAEIPLDPQRFGPDSLSGLDEFSHLDVVFVFHLRDESAVVTGARKPRGIAQFPEVGIFAQRASGRPNRIGVSTCEVLSVTGTSVAVRGLDAVDGTPVLDMKPHLLEMGPRGPVRQPSWVGHLMEHYWD
jgi:tRNA-Thr(GGU) m(6)t(6)A37 methyltransferase TsaA